MKTINLISYIIFFTGLILKFFHIHYNVIIILIGLGGVIVSLLVALIQKQEKAISLMELTNLGWMVLIFVSIKFLQIETVVMTIASLITLIFIIVTIRSKKFKMILTTLIPLSIGLFFYFMPTHERYQILSIKWNHEIDTDYITLDKYSWFLYQNDEFKEALEVSSKARNIAQQLNDSKWVAIIDSHHKAIEERIWKKYP